MGRILGNWRVIIATFFATVLIVGSFVLARGVESPAIAQASEEAALLQAIATRDADSDGLPDWEEALYDTDPHITDTLQLGMTDGEAVARGLVIPKAIADISVAVSPPASVDLNGLPPAPAEGTLTATFAQNFFTLFLAAKEANGGGDLSETQMNDVASQALSSLSSMVVTAPDFKSAEDLTVSSSGVDALKTFAVSAEAVLKRNTSNATTSEINYLKRALMNDDVTAFPYIVSIAKGYRDSAVGLSVLSVPRELATDYLALVNAMMRISQITTDFARMDTDPLATMLALQQYPQTVIALGNAFININKVYAMAGISLGAGEPGASLVNLFNDMKSEQAASAGKKP